MLTPHLPAIRQQHLSWNKGRLVGQKRPLIPKHVRTTRQVEFAESHHELALLNTAIDNKLRGWDLVRFLVADVFAAGQVKEQTSVLQSKPQKTVKFGLSDGT